MKKLHFYVALLVLLFGCNTFDDIQELPENTPNNTLKSAGDLKYDVLGRGYDITGRKDDYYSVRYSVIDMEKLETDHLSRIMIDHATNSYFNSTFSENSRSYITDISVDTKTEAKVEPFTSTITQSFSDYKSYSSQYSFATIEDINVYARIYVNADQSLLSNYLTDVFKSDLQTKSANQIIQIYGTHVLTDIQTGGKFRMTYRSSSNEINRKETVKAGATFAVEKLLGKSIDVIYKSELVEKNKEATLEYESVGGTNSYHDKFNIDTGISTLNIGAWVTSIYSGKIGSAIFISADYTKAIPIYELVSDASKKSQLKLAVENYINSKELDYRCPFFQFYNSRIKAHLYTIDPSELNGQSGWGAYGIEGYLFDYNAPGTVRLHKYYHTGAKDNFYTTDFSELGYGTGSWQYKSQSEYYVFKTQVPGTVPLYRYFSHKTHHHFYTTDWSNIGSGGRGYNFERIECYIYPE